MTILSMKPPKHYYCFFTFFLILLPLKTISASTFKIATAVPDGTAWMQEMRNAAKTIQTRTENRVKFKFYPGGVMGSDKSVLRKIRIGQLHGAAINSGGLADIYPNSLIYGLPLLFKNQNEVDYVRKRMDPIFNQGLESAGFVNFGIAGGGFALFMSSAKLNDIDDLKNNKMWIPEGDIASYETLKALGVTPVILPLTDVLTGLQTGLISTVAAPPSGAIAFQWHTKIKHVADLPIAYTFGVFIINRKSFKKLNESDQKLVRDTLNKTFERLDHSNQEANHSARLALEKNGILFTQPQAKAQTTWQKVSNQVIENLGKKGKFELEFAQKVQALILEYRSQQQTTTTAASS